MKTLFEFNSFSIHSGYVDGKKSIVIFAPYFLFVSLFKNKHCRIYCAINGSDGYKKYTLFNFGNRKI